MNEPVKLFFDECVGAHIAAGLGDFLRKTYGEKHDIRHIRDILKLGTPDEVWVPQIAAMGFVLITGDRSKDPKGKKLKLLCVKFQMTQIVFAHSLHSLKSAEKIRAVIAMWEPISLAAAAPRGARFMIGMSTGPVPKMWEAEVSEEERARAREYRI